MKKMLTIYTISVYMVPLFIILFLLSNAFFDSLAFFCFIMIFVSMGLCMLLGIVNLVFAVKEAAVYTENGFRNVMRFKLMHIPFFIVNFLFWLFYMAASANPFLIFTWVFIPVVVLYTYGVMLATSFHECGHLVTCKRKGLLGQHKIWYHIILQFIFVLDIIDSIVLYRKYRGID